MHPFAKARERTRALNAAKLDKIFSKPFVDSLEGHIDAVEVLVKPLESLTTVASGSWDGGAYRRLLVVYSVTSTAVETIARSYSSQPTHTVGDVEATAGPQGQDLWLVLWRLEG